MLDLKALLSKILDALKVDYIVEQGTSGDWIYRKWNSGIAECWAGYSIGSFAPTSSFGGTYYRILDKAFPTGLFNAPPKFAEVDTYWDTGNSWGSARALSKDTIQYSVFKNSNSSYSAQMRIYAIGTWKTFTGGVINTLKQFLINIFTLERGWVYC